MSNPHVSLGYRPEDGDPLAPPDWLLEVDDGLIATWDRRNPERPVLRVTALRRERLPVLAAIAATLALLVVAFAVGRLTT